MILAALVSLIATETAALIALIGYSVLNQRKNGNASGTRPVEFWEIRFREIHESVRDNRDELREIKWAIQAQAKTLNELAQAIQHLLDRRRT